MKGEYTAVHLSNGRGGPRCPSRKIDVPVTEDHSEITCAYCMRYLSKMNLTAGQISAMRRRGGKKAAKLPAANIKFARIF